ncbi:MAG: DUF3795 domain-containing protein [Chloroflexota bacterium]|nr:DUF3795 domain-containing protein [Chloroflexota bacterium]
MSKRFTALCGLYCLDCIPANQKLYSTINDLSMMLSELQFDKYASLKSQSNHVFKHYEMFIDVMRAIAELECNTPCREGGCKKNCAIRECVLCRGLDGCWECDCIRECKHLELLKKIHPNIEYHLKLIKKHGTEGWISRRKHHYWWQET